MVVGGGGILSASSTHLSSENGIAILRIVFLPLCLSFLLPTAIHIFFLPLVSAAPSPPHVVALSLPSHHASPLFSGHFSSTATLSLTLCRVPLHLVCHLRLAHLSTFLFVEHPFFTTAFALCLLLSIGEDEGGRACRKRTQHSR